jgi:hypothetical protein
MTALRNDGTLLRFNDPGQQAGSGAVDGWLDSFAVDSYFVLYSSAAQKWVLREGIGAL